MIHYTFENQKYYRENQEITADQAKYELGNSARWNWLNKTGKCNMREANLPEKPFVNSSKKDTKSDIKPLKNISKVKEKVDKVVKTKEQKQLCENNIRFIPKIAKLMTKQELDEFISCDYGYKSHPQPINYDLPIYAIYDGNELIFTTTDEHQAYKMVNNINNDGGCGYYTIQ